MNVIESSSLGQAPIAMGQEHGKLAIYGGLSTPYSDDVIRLTGDHAQQIETFAASAADAYGDVAGTKEPTAAQTRFGVPSLMVRVDCTVVDGNIVPYEAEDSPSGQGIAHLLHRQATGEGLQQTILGHYENLTGDVPFVIVSNARKHGTDDPIVVGEENYFFGPPEELRLPDSRLVIVKGIPGQPDSHAPYLRLQERALAPMTTEGNKHYMPRLGRSRPLRDPSELLRRPDGALQSQVVKASVGSMAMGVSIHLSLVHRPIHGEKGTVSAGRLERDAQQYIERGGATTEPFNPPIMLENLEGRRHGILRVFVQLERSAGRTEARAIGGCLVARPELIVHGAGNSVAAAVVVG